jgi:hypothetical protein
LTSRSPLLDLIRAYLAGRTDFPFVSLDPACLSWSLESGLGPLLARTSRDDPGARAAPAWAEVRGSDLACRVLMEQQAEATVELIEACRPKVGALTLLKGIWLSHTLYPEPHLRPMRDVDVMVEPEAVGDVERILVGLGYRPVEGLDPASFRAHHHAVPYRHPATGVHVEVHRGLVRPDGPYGSDRPFDPAHVRAGLREGVFRGRPVRHLADELQVVYLAAHWAAGGNASRGPGGQLVLIDVVRLAASVDWQQVVRELAGTAAATAAVLLLTYLETRGLLVLPADVRGPLWRTQRSFGDLNLGVLHRLVDRRLLEGRPYGRWVGSRFNAEIVWTTLIRPRPAFLNLLMLPWSLWSAHSTGRRSPRARDPRARAGALTSGQPESR